MTSCLLRLHPLTKINIIPFRLLTRVVQIFIYQPLNCFGLISTLPNQFFPFQSDQMKRLKAPRPMDRILPSPPLLFIAIFTSHRSPLSERLEQAKFKDTWIFSRGVNRLYKPTRYVPAQRVWFLHLFGLKTVRTWRTGGPTPTKNPQEHPPLGFQSLSGSK